MPILYSKEGIIQCVSQINISNFFNAGSLCFYFLVFNFTHFSNFFSLALPHLPLYGGLYIPLMITIAGGFIFWLSPDEYYAFPLSALNGISILCQIIQLVLLIQSYSFCWQPDIVSSGICSYTEYFLLTVASLLTILIIVMSLIAIFSYVLFSNAIDQNLALRQQAEGAYTSAEAEVDSTRQ